VCLGSVGGQFEDGGVASGCGLAPSAVVSFILLTVHGEPRESPSTKYPGWELENTHIPALWIPKSVTLVAHAARHRGSSMVSDLRGLELVEELTPRDRDLKPNASDLVRRGRSGMTVS
jgi:hypothetical protein